MTDIKKPYSFLFALLFDHAGKNRARSLLLSIKQIRRQSALFLPVHRACLLLFFMLFQQLPHLNLQFNYGVNRLKQTETKKQIKKKVVLKQLP